MGRISKIDPWHRPRGTVEDEIEVTEHWRRWVVSADPYELCTNSAAAPDGLCSGWKP